MKQPQKVTLDDVQCDSEHLARLLDVVMEQIAERDNMDRVSALVWIARDMAERTEANIGEVMKNLMAAREKEAAGV